MVVDEDGRPLESVAELRAAIARTEAQMEHITSSWMTLIDDPAVRRYETLARRLSELHAALVLAERP